VAVGATAGPGPAPDNINHFRRVAIIWAVATVILTPLAIWVAGPGLPPGDGSVEAHGQVVDNTVLLATSTPLALVVLVVFIFLWNFRSTIISAIAIPTSIIAAFAFLAAFGYSLNQMTMLALTLMVGIVIDDAIVVVEAVERYIQAGLEQRGQRRLTQTGQVLSE